MTRKYWPSLPVRAVDWELTSIVMARPLAALILYPVRDTVHPNAVTIASLVTYLLGVWQLWAGNGWAAALLLLLGMVLDDGDGLLARYQGRTSLLGSYLDKTSDVIRFWALFSVVGYLAWRSSMNPLHLYLAGMASFALMVQGYVKWIVEPFVTAPKSEDLSANLPKSLDKSVFVPGILKALLWPFHECDLTVWAAVLGVMSNFELLDWVLAGSQSVAAVIALVSRLIMVVRYESRSA